MSDLKTKRKKQRLSPKETELKAEIELLQQMLHLESLGKLPEEIKPKCKKCGSVTWSVAAFDDDDKEYPFSCIDCPSWGKHH